MNLGPACRSTTSTHIRSAWQSGWGGSRTNSNFTFHPSRKPCRLTLGGVRKSGWAARCASLSPSDSTQRLSNGLSPWWG